VTPAEKIGIPLRPFLWTLDQIATIINLDVRTVKIHYVYYEGRSTGGVTRSKMIARNISPRDQPAEWRVAHEEMLRWLKSKGFRFYEEGRLRS